MRSTFTLYPCASSRPMVSMAELEPADAIPVGMSSIPMAAAATATRVIMVARIARLRSRSGRCDVALSPSSRLAGWPVTYIDETGRRMVHEVHTEKDPAGRGSGRALAFLLGGTP